jgi:hypothetical protein
MNDDMLSSELEPAITPAFLAQLDQLAQGGDVDERPDMSWISFLLNRITGRAPQLQAREVSSASGLA